MPMKSILAKFVCVVALLGLVANANANLYFDWAFNGTHGGTDITASGTFSTDESTTTSGSFTGFLINAISGNVNTSDAISSLVAPSISNDNLVQAVDPSFDATGVAFIAAGVNYQLFYDGSNYQLYNGTVTFAANSFSISEVPEPVNVALGLFGIGVVGLGMKRHFKKAAQPVQ